jgi:DNA-binding IclR family transcriptional regulator
MSNTAGRDGGIQSANRAISGLEILTWRGEAGVSEDAVEIDVHKSTAFRLLGALEGRGLVEQSADHGKYRLGFGLIPLASAVSDWLDVTRQGRQVCERLAAELGETIIRAVLQESCVVNVDQVLGPSTVSTQNWISRLTLLHCTTSGKVLLAHLPPAGRIRLIAGVEPMTLHTLSPAALQSELDRVRAQGWARAVEEYKISINVLPSPSTTRPAGWSRPWTLAARPTGSTRSAAPTW